MDVDSEQMEFRSGSRKSCPVRSMRICVLSRFGNFILLYYKAELKACMHAICHVMFFSKFSIAQCFLFSSFRG